MKYSFLEIGTSDFNTLIEQSLDNEKGIWIPPIPRPEEGPGLPIHEWNETSKSWQVRIDF
jgi:hypothetical protein